MMKKNKQLYQYLIILSAFSSAPFVLANDAELNRSNEKANAAMPVAPSGPYRSQNNIVAHQIQRQASRIEQRPAQQPMPVRNRNQYRPQPMQAPQWVQRQPQQQVPEWVKNPPYGPKPPAWVINPPQQHGYAYRYPMNRR